MSDWSRTHKNTRAEWFMSSVVLHSSIQHSIFSSLQLFASLFKGHRVLRDTAICRCYAVVWVCPPFAYNVIGRCVQLPGEKLWKPNLSHSSNIHSTVKGWNVGDFCFTLKMGLKFSSSSWVVVEWCRFRFIFCVFVIDENSYTTEKSYMTPHPSLLSLFIKCFLALVCQEILLYYWEILSAN